MDHRRVPDVAPLALPPISRRAALTAAGAAAVAAVPLFGARRPAVGQAGTPVATDGEEFTLEEQLALTRIVEESLAQTSTPGALVGVWYPGRGNWTYAAGVSDLSTAAPVSLDHHVRIASITKTFVATAVLQLVDEGVLGLEDRLEQFVPGIPNGDQITLRQVLGMTAGIYDYVAAPVIAEGYEQDPAIAFDPNEVVDIVRAAQPDFAPGEQVRYSNSNYVLLGLILEQVTGQSAAQVVLDRVVAPLGLQETSFPETADLPEPYLHGYSVGADGVTLRDVSLSNPLVPWTAGAMVSTLAEMRIWAEALAGGTLLSEATQRERLTWNAFPGEGLRVSYGLGVLQVNGLVGHNGGIPGYSSWMLHAPEEGATMVVVTNRSVTEGGTADPIFIGIAQLLFPDRFGAPEATPAAATPSA